MNRNELKRKIRLVAKNAAMGATERMAEVVLNRWHMSYMQKAYGGMDEFGEEWADISDGWRNEKRRTRLGWQDVDRDQVWQERRNAFVGQLVAGGWTFNAAMDRANELAWQGDLEVPIGINTGDLQESISPDGSEHQIREVTPTGLQLGTTVEYANYFNDTRRFRPTGDEVKTWVKDSAKYVRDGIIGGLL